MVNYDDWREVINGPETYAEIAARLLTQGAVIIGWTDQNSTHYDILFTMRPAQFGSLQGGVRGPRDLFVSIMRRGCFAFDILSMPSLHPGYIQEKLGISTECPTSVALTELINGVITAVAIPGVSDAQGHHAG